MTQQDFVSAGMIEKLPHPPDALGHDAIASGEQHLDVLQRRAVLDQFHARHLGQRLTGQVIERRPQPAREYHDLGSATGPADRRRNALTVVTEGHLFDGANPSLRQPYS